MNIPGKGSELSNGSNILFLSLTNVLQFHFSCCLSTNDMTCIATSRPYPLSYVGKRKQGMFLSNVPFEFFFSFEAFPGMTLAGWTRAVQFKMPYLASVWAANGYETFLQCALGRVAVIVYVLTRRQLVIAYTNISLNVPLIEGLRLQVAEGLGFKFRP
jgi:hypothetical protein